MCLDYQIKQLILPDKFNVCFTLFRLFLQICFNFIKQVSKLIMCLEPGYNGHKKDFIFSKT